MSDVKKDTQAVELVEGEKLATTTATAPDAEKKGSETSSDDGAKKTPAAMEAAELARQSEILENPLAYKSEAEILADVETFTKDHGLTDKLDLFKRAALLAANPKGYEERDDITEEEKVVLREEITHKWRQPWSMYYIALISSLAAVVQGMDESVVNGAQVFYYTDFGIDNSESTIIQGLVNSAPYLCCFVLACWLTAPLNHYFGRRGTIWISCFIAGAASIWEAFTYSWPQLFAARFVLGLGIGPKSSTAPVYTAECSPAPIRGALVMMWQMWTAFGIMLGYVVGVIFAPPRIDPNLAWRLMLGSTVVAPIFVCSMIYLGPESPRWYIKKDRYADALKAMSRLRRNELQAARDIYYMRAILEAESDLKKGKNLLKEMVTVPRNRRAMVASGLVMFMQQFCGVNVIAYYSSTIFINAGFGTTNALYASLGTGILNWLFAIPAFYTIDTFGRRKLLLITFPLMAICLLITGFAFFIPEKNAAGDYNPARIGVVTLGIYLFEVFYSPGEGPVPFTYSAEAFPLYIRELGMSYATAVTWCFNFVLAITFPKLLDAFTPQGAFGYYAAWCMLGWVAVFLILPETKSLTLEELDLVFSVPHRRHIRYQFSVLKYHIDRILGKHPEPIPPLYAISEKLLEA